MSLSIIRRVTDLTNSQVQNLPTAPIEIVPTPGAGYTVNFFQALLIAKFAAGAYTGASTTSSWIVISNASDQTISSFIGNDSTASVPLTYLTVFLDATNKAFPLVPFQDTSDVAAQWGLLAHPETSTNHNNLALRIRATNGGVNFGGGNAANSLRVVVYYTIEAIP